VCELTLQALQSSGKRIFIFHHFLPSRAQVKKFSTFHHFLPSNTYFKIFEFQNFLMVWPLKPHPLLFLKQEGPYGGGYPTFYMK
jgi:hypothetical protein